MPRVSNSWDINLPPFLTCLRFFLIINLSRFCIERQTVTEKIDLPLVYKLTRNLSLIFLIELKENFLLLSRIFWKTSSKTNLLKRQFFLCLENCFLAGNRRLQFFYKAVYNQNLHFNNALTWFEFFPRLDNLYYNIIYFTHCF